MNTSYIIDPIEERWNQAVASPSIPLWSTIAEWSEHMADALEANNPDNIMVVAHRAISQEARKRMLAMEPKKEESHA